MKLIRGALALCLAAFLFASCAGPQSEEPPGAGGSTVRSAVTSSEVQFTQPAAGSPAAVIETNFGAIYVVLYEKYAPLAVENFQLLAEAGYYNGTQFHRVVQDFMIQGGDPTGTGLGGASTWGEPFLSEYTDKLHHYAGALCMAPADGARDTNMSQFYIVASPQGNITDEAAAKMQAAGMREAVIETYRQAGGEPYLDFTATVFGQVYAGMDVVDEIARQAADEDGRPKQAITILSVTLSTYAAPAASAPPASPSGEGAPPSSAPASLAPEAGTSLPPEDGSSAAE